MVPERSDRPTRDGGTQIVPELRAEADRLRHLSDPKLTAPIYDESSDAESDRRRPTFFARLREALLP